LGVGANLAVLVGLVFVGVEVRNSRSTLQMQAADGIAEGFLSMNLAMMTDTAVARVWDQGIHAPDSLTDIEAMQFSMHLRALFNQFERIHSLYAEGLLSHDEWGLYAREALYLMETEGGRLHFAGNQLHDEFVADLEPFRGLPRNIDLRLGRER
jgi:hypothetical protein